MTLAMRNRRYLIKALVGVLLIVGVSLMPPVGPVSPQGMRVLGIFIGTIWLYSTCALTWPSLLALVALGLSGVYGSVDEVAELAIPGLVVQVIAMMTFCEGLRRSGAVHVIAWTTLFSGRIAERPMHIVFCALMVSFALGVSVGITGAVVVTFMMIDELLSDAGYEKGDCFYRHMLVGGFVMSYLGGAAIPQRGIAFALTNSYSAVTGLPLPGGAYMAAVCVVSIATATFFTLLMRLNPSCDIETLRRSISGNFGKQVSGLTAAQVVMVSALGVVVAASLLITLVPQELSGGTPLGALGYTGVLCLVMVVLSLIEVDGKLAFDVSVCMKQGVPWGIVLATGTMLCISITLISEPLGITAAIVQTFGALLTNMPPACFVFAVVFATVIVTGFVSSTVTCAIMMSVAVPLAPVMGISPVVLGVAIAMSASLGVLSPGGSAPAPLLFGRRDLSFPAIYRMLVPYLATYSVVVSTAVLVVNLIV